MPSQRSTNIRGILQDHCFNMDLSLWKISLVVITLLFGCDFYPSCAEDVVQSALGSDEVLSVWAKPGKRFEFMLTDLLPRSLEGNIKVRIFRPCILILYSYTLTQLNTFFRFRGSNG